ncbi:MAG: pyridoxamine 5'-phosphate oxidase family protein [Planctomycetales bacterium]|jgi:PPOX class probable FMN-dependent enzyme|nr:pyridoxamine 5'-phosphate oxidase family protein [Planctomycetales bacterium]|tara:strand:+ start:1102 stop:1731 length:630 start_codon:yes stop_codon:yes gene_type:complete
MSEQPSGQVESVDQLREFYDDPSLLSQQKFMETLDDHCRAMIARSSFYCIATMNPDGSLDISPRGDPPGSVVVLDPSTLLLPDRRGNNKLDSMSNVTERSRTALLFLVPGVLETLRVTGSAAVIHDDPRLEACAIEGQVPQVGILVSVEKACLQCGKAVKRGGLWEETYRISRSELPSFGKMLADQTDTGQTVEELDQSIDDAYENRLY